MTITVNVETEWKGEEFTERAEKAAEAGLGRVAALGADLAAQSMPGSGATAVPGPTGRLVYTPSAPGQPPGVRTNRLRGSLTWDRLGRLRAGFGTNVRYGRFLEEGTSRMAARPYLKVAAHRLKSRAQKEFAKGMARALARGSR